MIKSVILFLVTKEMSKEQQMHAKAGQERTEIMGQKQQALEIIQAERSGLEALSDAIWDHPEVGYQETFAAETFCGFLEEKGFLVERKLAGIETAFLGKFGAGSPVIGFLGEFDALPGMSQEAGCFEKKPAEKGKPGHGCGHNLLGTGALAAALAVKAYLEKGHEGTVIFFGCPAEEGGAGKAFMAKAGVFDCLDAAFTWHPGDTCNVSSGTNLANCQVCYHFKGKASHAAIAPELGRSALDAAELMNVGVQFLREHIPASCRVHYAITNSGGSAPGVVQEEADVLYLMRAPELGMVRELYERVSEIARGAAIMTGTKTEAEFIKATSNILVNQTLGRVMQKNLEELGAPAYDEDDREFAAKICGTLETKDRFFERLVEEIGDQEQYERLKPYVESSIYDVVIPYSGTIKQSFASSDVGDVSWVCPVAQISMPTMPGGVAMHSWQMTAVGKSAMAKKGMLRAGEVMAASAIDLFENPEIIEKAKAERDRRAGGLAYVSPIPDGVRPGNKK